MSGPRDHGIGDYAEPLSFGASLSQLSMAAARDDAARRRAWEEAPARLVLQALLNVATDFTDNTATLNLHDAAGEVLRLLAHAGIALGPPRAMNVELPEEDDAS